MDGFFQAWWDSGSENPEEFASLVQQYADSIRLIEREACAKVCESLFDIDDDSCNEAEQCAAAIRMRSND